MRHAAVRLVWIAVLFTPAVGCTERSPRAEPSEPEGGQMEIGLNPRWDREPEVEPTPQRLYGRWVVKRYEHNDCAFVDFWPGFKNRRPEFEIGADGLRLTAETESGQPSVLGLPFRIYADRSPKQFDVEGPQRPVRGIFKLLSDGRLVIAIRDDLANEDMPPAAPTNFDSRRRDIIVLICERSPPAPAAPIP
jgi:hypothetical protein